MHALVIPLAIAGLLPYVLTASSKIGAFSRADNARTREWQRTLAGWRQRAYWAQLNSFEGFPLFAAAVLTAMMLRPTDGTGLALAWGYVAARVAYSACYILHRPSLRSLVWLVGLACCLALFVLAASTHTG